ncbi:MAG TPA: IS630 family transposase [Verrucomicrobiae bacterium]|nr:IS630 family transposase [Verrucomicrobiae bacterium]
MTRPAATRIARRTLEDTRHQAIRLLERGLHPEAAAVAVGCGRSTVYGWWQAYQVGGLAALRVRKAPGARPKLTPRQQAQLRRWITGKDPRQLQFDVALWTRDLVRTLIAERFGVEMSAQGASNLLQRLGLSPERPLVRAYQQDPERVRRWRAVELPRIRAATKAASGHIFFCDETGVRTDHHPGTSWGAGGQTPGVRGTGQRRALHMISAISTRGTLHFAVIEGQTTADSFIAFLHKLLHDIRGPIFVIVDGHPAHTASKTKAFVQTHPRLLGLCFLSPYSRS